MAGVLWSWNGVTKKKRKLKCETMFDAVNGQNALDVRTTAEGRSPESAEASRALLIRPNFLMSCAHACKCADDEICRECTGSKN